MNYQFDFSKTTFDEIEATQKSKNIGEMLAFYDKITVGGIRHLPPNEVFFVLLPQFITAIDLWMRSGRIDDIMPKPQVFDTPTNDDEAVRGMLDGIEGL